jgi:8-oxo-dGTP pyrophosphatase MutT (NUDIX family)
MYKVFFNDRVLFLTDEFSKNFQSRYGLFFKYEDEIDLEEVIDIYSKLTKINSLTIFHYDLEKLQKDFKKCFKYIEAAGGVVQNQKGEYLLIFRLGKWDLPKGKLEKGENFQQAGVREVIEETGLQEISIAKPLLSTYHTYAYKGRIALKKTFWLSMDYTGKGTPVPQTEEDIVEVKWFKASELSEPFKNTYPAVLDIFKYLGVIK